jgi:hypothetical protein
MQTQEPGGGFYAQRGGNWQTPYENQGAVAMALDEARWKRAMEFLQGGGFNQVMSGMGSYGDQYASAKAQPAIRNFQNQRRDVANRIGARGMSLSSANDQAMGETYGTLSRALAEAGTAGDVAQKELGMNFLSQLLQFARG